MGRISKSERIELWLDRLNRQCVSGESISKFCGTEGISVPSFYQWKRRLAPIVVERSAGRRSKRRPTPASASFAEVQVVDSFSSASVFLPSGIRIQLGSDPQVAESIIDRVLRHSAASTESEP